MATAYISTNTELSLVNTISQNLTLFLPQNPINGRNLFVKDAAGNSFRSTITLSTLGTNTFENGSVLQTLNSAYESMQLTYNSNVWYFTGGMMFNTLRASTLQALTFQTSNLSTLNATLSSFQINDVPTSSIGTFNTVSSFLLYNGFNIGGGLRTAIPQTLNSFRFSPYQYGLFIWLDAADSSTVTRTGANVTRWTDKSINSFTFILSGTTNPTYSNSIQNNNSAIYFDGTNQVMNSSVRNFSNGAYTVFTVQYLTSTTGSSSGFQRVINGGPDSTLFVGVNGTTIAAFTGNGLGGWNDIAVLVPNYTNLATWRIVSFTINSTVLTSFIDGNPTSIKVGTTGSITSIFIGGLTNAQYWNGYLGEFLIYSNVLGTFQRQQTEGYLAWKWGIQSQLPASHPFKNAPPQ